MRSNPHAVFLKKPEPKGIRRLKIQLLSPFVARYRDKSKLLGLDAGVQSLINDSVASDDGKVLFVNNRKSGCSFGMSLVHFWSKGHISSSIHTTDDIMRGAANRGAFAKMIADPTVFRFSFLRKPSQRTISAFNYFFTNCVRTNSKLHLPYLEPRGFKFGEKSDRNFEIFLEYVEESMAHEDFRIDRHFRSQLGNLRPDLVEYDRICCLENLDEELPKLIDLAKRKGLSLPLPPPLPRNSVENKFVPNDDLIRRINKLYAKDCDFYAQLTSRSP